MDDDLINDYIEEAQDILVRITGLLDSITAESVTSEDIEELFRGIHTIKGGAGMFEWTNTQEVAHQLESFLGDCKNNPKIFDYGKVRSEVDKIESLIENSDRLDQFTESPTKEIEAQPEVTPAPEPYFQSRFFKDFCHNFDDFLKSQIEAGFHYYEVLIPGIVKERFLGFLENCSFQTIEKTQLGENVALLISCHEDCKKKSYDLLAKLYEFDSFAEILPKRTPALTVEIQKPETVEKAQVSKKVDVLRVPIDRVNDALNSIWEIFLLRNQVAYLFEKNKTFLQKHPDVTQEWEILDNSLKRNIDELESTIMSMRMNNMSALFSRMKKVVRSYQSNTLKDINFVVEGEEIELDKKVLDMLGEPLIHLVRNAMDHGIENAEGRKKSGKSHQGQIILRAESMSDKVVISLIDDGKGIDPEKILEKAKEKGIATEHLKAPSEITNLIFSSGFSTAETVTDVSGRGVGMDAVKKSILKLGGEIFIESTVGSGSTFRIELPLSMAVISSILFDVNGKTYGSSINNLVEVCREPEEILQQNNNSLLFPYRGEFLECYDLRNFFISDEPSLEKGAPKPNIATFCIMEVNGRKAAIRVNKVSKHTEIVVKEMRGAFPDVSCLNGVSILATGEPIFVVSLTKIVRKFWEGGIEHAA